MSFDPVRFLHRAYAHIVRHSMLPRAWYDDSRLWDKNTGRYPLDWRELHETEKVFKSVIALHSGRL